MEQWQLLMLGIAFLIGSIIGVIVFDQLTS
jgi:hypothetical protein